MLERLKNAGLSHKVSCYIPATNDVNKAADNTREVESCAKLLSELFGGATIIPARGAWVSDEHGLVLENTTIVYAFADNIADENLDKICTFMDYIRDSMKQECVSLEVDNRLYFL